MDIVHVYSKNKTSFQWFQNTLRGIVIYVYQVIDTSLTLFSGSCLLVHESCSWFLTSSRFLTPVPGSLFAFKRSGSHASSLFLVPITGSHSGSR